MLLNEFVVALVAANLFAENIDYQHFMILRRINSPLHEVNNLRQFDDFQILLPMAIS